MDALKNSLKLRAKKGRGRRRNLRANESAPDRTALGSGAIVRQMPTRSRAADRCAASRRLVLIV